MSRLLRAADLMLQVFSLLGSTTSAFVCYIVPGMFVVKIQDGPWWGANKLPAWILIVGGTVMGATCTVVTIINL